MIEPSPTETQPPADGEPAFKYDVFISYNHADRAWVQNWLVPHLEGQKLVVCVDYKDFDYGEPPTRLMALATQKSRYTLAVLTPAYLKSDWTEFELVLGNQLRRTLTLKLEPCELPYNLAWSWADFTTEADREFAFGRLVERIRGIRRLTSDDDEQQQNVSGTESVTPENREGTPTPPAPSVERILDALADLTQTREGYHQAEQYRASFQSALKHIEIVADYKQLHDELHALQFECYSLLVSQMKLADTDALFEFARELLHNLEGVIESIDDIIRKGNVPEQESVWATTLKQTADVFREGIEQDDLNKLQNVRYRLQRILQKQPARINTLLCEEARQLDLSTLSEPLSWFQDQLAQRHADPSHLQVIAESVSGLLRLDAEKKRLLHEHDCWQRLEDELREIEIMLGTQADVGELEGRWGDLRKLVLERCCDCPEDWATKLLDSVDKLDAALGSQSPVQIRRAFAALRSPAGRRFASVDRELLDLCEKQLRPIGDGLKAVLRMAV